MCSAHVDLQTVFIVVSVSTRTTLDHHENDEESSCVLCEDTMGIVCRGGGTRIRLPDIRRGSKFMYDDLKGSEYPKLFSHVYCVFYAPNLPFLTFFAHFSQ